MNEIKIKCPRCGKDLLFEPWLYPHEDDTLKGFWSCVCGYSESEHDTSKQKDILKDGGTKANDSTEGNKE